MRILRLWLIGVRVKASGLAGLLIVIFILASFPNKSVFAQDPNNNYCVNPQGAATGGFTLDKVRVCVGTAIRVTGGIPAGMQNVGYIKEYDGKGIPANFELGPFQYSKAGSYTILQVGTINGLRALACQTVTVLPLDPIKFTVQACLGRRATVTADPSTLGQYDSYIIRWGDGNIDDRLSKDDMRANPAHTYNSGSSISPTITIEGVYTSLCNGPQATQPVTLLGAATQPFITELTTTSDKAIDIKYQTNTGVSVKLFQKINGTYSDIGQQGSGLGTFTVQTDAKQEQCFQLVAQDACNSTASLKSDEVCSLVLNVKADNKQNNLTWKRYTGSVPLRSYEITRNNVFLNRVIGDSRPINYSDAAAIECGTQYCYSITATITGVGQTIVKSAPVCVNGTNGDVPGDINTVLVSIEDGHPRLITTPPTEIGPTDSYTMIVSRASGPSGSFQPVATLDRKSTYTDESANPSAGSYCYQVTYQNGCGLQSNPSTPVCTVFLEAKSNTGIDWNTDSPFTPEAVASYTLEVIDSLNGTKQEIPLASNTHYEPDPDDPNLQSQKYRVIAVSDGGTISYSNYYTFRREARILIPDAFTPNGDGMNEEFLPKGVYVDKFTMNIYTRWGEVVYSTTDKSQGWDGKINGQPAGVGQYMYRIELIDLTGLKTVRTGALLLIR